MAALPEAGDKDGDSMVLQETLSPLLPSGVDFSATQADNLGSGPLFRRGALIKFKIKGNQVYNQT